MPGCNHGALQLDVSSHAADAGYTRPLLTRRQAATTPSGRVTRNTADCARLESLFPGPLVLPDDALAIDPKEPPQSLRSWITEKWRNPVTQRRKTIYVAAAPSSAPELRSTLSKWAIPSVPQTPQKGACNPPNAELISEYLSAFYHPFPVKLLPDQASFVPWMGGKPVKANGTKPQQHPQYIGMRIGSNFTGITTRPCPDDAFPRQLNLNDILDAAMAALPDDAYALVMLTNHDLYEDEDDDFCCGRAYGGSRIAVVSSARYNPLLDEASVVEREHMWPLSHCEKYVTRLCREAGGQEPSASNKRRRTGRAKKERPSKEEGMACVVQAALAAPDPMLSPSGVWFSRVARTVSHEVGHCFCLGHCTYYACVMQGTAGIAEDMRQPPYLCPVCLAKVTRAIRDVERGGDEVQFMIERYTALVKFCAAWEVVGMFAAYRCWLEKRIEMLKATLAGEK